ncbi:ferrous iron transport protein A [Methanosarcina sp. DH1]|uniref:FeoA family protein n=1 Tax=Methanosarcina sp. DH1 TaxID=2605695 RepID=UPI001E28C479|nr:FeoA family protein [Methanosarcina sp. DH1]MCC4767161.1 ferrous iron transport protein A [Methanosarcina sp. DH1]
MVTKNPHFDLKTITLCAMEPRKTGKIAHLETKNPGILQKLIAMGILPGMPITLIRRSPSYLFEVDQTRYAVDKEIANNIYVSY